MKTFMLPILFVMTLAFSTSSNSQMNKSDEDFNVSGLTVNCDKLSTNTYNSARAHGSSTGQADQIAREVWKDCVDQGGSHSGSCAPVNLEIKKK